MAASWPLPIFFLRYLLPVMVVAWMSMWAKGAVTGEVLDGECAGRQGVSYGPWKLMDTKQM